jgi:hypothetical protein
MKDISGFDGYKVDENGQVWSFRKGKRRLQPYLYRGYQKVSLCKNGKGYNRFVHRLVLETFIGICPSGMQACHNNGVRVDNRLGNLRWGTAKENQADRKAHGTEVHGEKHWHTKLNEKQVRVIKHCIKNGMWVKDIAKYFPVVKASTIHEIKKGKNWKHVII